MKQITNKENAIFMLYTVFKCVWMLSTNSQLNSNLRKGKTYPDSEVLRYAKFLLKKSNKVVLKVPSFNKSIKNIAHTF